MTKKRAGFFVATAMILSLCIGTLLGCQKGNVAKTAYTLQVMSEGEKSLSDIKVYIYEDKNQERLVWAAETDEEGKVVFEAEESENYVAVLQEVPDGYAAEEIYFIRSEQTDIKLNTVLTEDGTSAESIYELGDVMYDFSVVAVDGKTYQLSELLHEKKAVVLNFWFLNCGPCKMEFPYMQQAYEEYKSDIEILALNPVDGTKEKILTYIQENGLTFPMAVGDMNWQSQMRLTAYPTTVVIDRYGTIAMIHQGSITDKETFTKIFAYFTSDEYEQTTIRNISDIES